ncbi:MAG: hypothetical protein JXJ04_09500 [Spirochaetales bacterium]|nr:hypothetical protein [Spirochaetales bacterium]
MLSNKKNALPFLLFLLIIIIGVSSVFAAFGPKSEVLEDFEDNTDWKITADPAQGITVSVSRRDGKPADFARLEKNIISSAGIKPEDQKKVLGIKIEIVDFDEFRILIQPTTPVKIGRGLRSFHLWVAGKNSPHLLYAVLADKDKQPFCDIFLGKLYFYGWKRLSSFYNPNQWGFPDQDIYFQGLKLILDPMEIGKGVIYLYFDFISIEKESLPDEK